MKRSTKATLLLILGVVVPGLFLWGPTARAYQPEDSAPQLDDILLRDGSRIRGEIYRLEDGTLIVDTTWAGRLELNFDEVETVQSGRDLLFVMRDGSRRPARPMAREDGKIGLETQLNGTLEVDLSDVDAINPPLGSVRHKGNVMIASKFKDGNAREKSANLDAEYIARADSYRFTFRADCDYEQNNGELTERDTDFFGKYDYFFLEKTFAYVNAKMESDEFADLNLRSTFGAGLGYQFKETSKLAYYQEGGLSHINRNFDQGNDERSTVMRLGGSLDWRLMPRVTLFHRHEFFFGLDDQDDIVADTTTGLRFKMIGNLSVDAKIDWDFDNTPAPGARRSDTEYILGLGYSFDF